MRRLTISLTLICMLLANGVTSQARKNPLKQTKSRTEVKTRKSSAPQKQVARRESAKDKAMRRELIKRNPRLKSLFYRRSMPITIAPINHRKQWSGI